MEAVHHRYVHRGSQYMATESIVTMDILEFRQSRVDCTHDEHFDVLPNADSVSPVVLLYSRPEFHRLYGN